MSSVPRSDGSMPLDPADGPDADRLMEPGAHFLTWGNHLPGWRNWAVMFLLAAALAVVSFSNFLLFHTLAELFAVIIGILMFVVAWNTFAFSRNHFLMFLGCGYFWVSILDLVHTMVYKGMGIFPLTGANPSIQFWIATRFFEALLLLTAPLFLRRAMPCRLVFVAAGVAAVTVCLLVINGRFPVAFIEGQGLTQFKILSEYLIVVLLAVAIVHLARHRALLEPKIFTMMVLSLLLTMGAELAFTFYVSVYGLSNMVGHIFKLFSFWLIFEAIIQTTLREPFRIMARGASTYDAIPDPTVVVDRSGIIRQVNSAACDVTALPETALVGRHCHETFHWAETARDQCVVCRHIAAGDELDETEVQIGTEGEWRRFTLASIEMQDMAGGLVHVCADITWRKRAERRLKEGKEVLERSNAELRNFAYIVSHDLNEPLNLVAGYVKLIDRRYRGRLDTDADEFIGYTVQGIDRMKIMIRGILDFSRVDSTAQSIEQTELSEVLDEALTILRPRIDETQATITHDQLPVLDVDRLQMVRVFQNLLSNAINYHSENRLPVVHIGTEKHGNEWLFSVRDNGIGIAPEHLENIFLIFNRIGSKDPQKGLGIGLSLCRRIVVRHGGRIWAESQPGEWSAIHFSLPAEVSPDPA